MDPLCNYPDDCYKHAMDLCSSRGLLTSLRMYLMIRLQMVKRTYLLVCQRCLYVLDTNPITPHAALEKHG